MTEPLANPSPRKASRKCRHEGCGRIVWEGDDDNACVFHSARSVEKAEAFDRAWARFLKKHAAGEDAYRYLNCRGFVFPAALSFAHASFGGGADFREARFVGPARFEGAHSRENAYFSGARFEGDARFEGARIDKTANFDDVHFDAAASFESARFGGRAEFRRSCFDAPGAFGGARFAGDALFQDARCPGGLRFGGARFEGRLDFAGAAGGPISLDEADLTGADLRECSLRKVRITRVTRHRRARFGPSDLSGVDWTGSNSLRRSALHQNHIFDFRRKNTLNRWILYPLWKATSDCGCSPARWVLAAAAVVLAFGGLYAWMGTAWFPAAATWDAAGPYRESLRALLTLGLSGRSAPAGGAAARIAALTEGLLGGVLIASLLSILAAKFSRRAS